MASKKLNALKIIPPADDTLPARQVGGKGLIRRQLESPEARRLQTQSRDCANGLGERDVPVNYTPKSPMLVFS